MMSRDAKSALSKTIRALRARLLDDLHDAVQSRYRLQITPADEANLPPQLAVDRATLEAYDRAELEAARERLGLDSAPRQNHRRLSARFLGRAAGGEDGTATLTPGTDAAPDATACACRAVWPDVGEPLAAANHCGVAAPTAAV